MHIIYTQLKGLQSHDRAVTKATLLVEVNSKTKTGEGRSHIKSLLTRRYLWGEKVEEKVLGNKICSWHSHQFSCYAYHLAGGMLTKSVA